MLAPADAESNRQLRNQIEPFERALSNDQIANNLY